MLTRVVMTYQDDRTITARFALYILDIIKVRDILIRVFFHEVKPCQSLTAYYRMNGAYAPLPASISPHSRTSCRILPWRWSATSTARLSMAISAKVTAR